MAQRLFVPKLGHTMTEGIVAKWHKAQDAHVEAGEPVYDLEYDKATETIEAEKSGVLKRLVEEGDSVPVGDNVGVILEEGDDLDTVLAQKVYKAFVGQTFHVPTAARSMSSYGEKQTQEVSKTPEKIPEAIPSSEKPDADVVVLGGGPGGYVAALRAGLLGLSVILIEKERLGGTCLNRGCIPTKALLESAKKYDDCLHAAAFGIQVSGASVDANAVNERKKKVVDTLVNGVYGLLKARKVTVMAGEASFVSSTKLSVKTADGEKTVIAKNIIIATGSVPSAPPIPGIDGNGVMTSNEALELTEIPKSLAIIGGGVIGMELGTVYARFGAKVTVLEALDEILPTVDADIAKRFHKLASGDMDIRTGCRVSEIADCANGKRISFERSGAKDAVEAEKVLVCIGRKPAVASLNLEAAGVKTEKGRVIVDENWRTNAPNIYCIGDANGKLMLAHAASAQGVDAADLIAGRTVDHARHAVVPSCVYTTPELASVGKSEKELISAGIAYKAAKFPMRANGRALVLGETDGIVKILYGQTHREVLGVHIMGPTATELIAECALALRLECTLEELSETIHAHPTVSETVMEAAEAGLLGAIHSL